MDGARGSRRPRGILPECSHRSFRAREALAAGLLTRGQLRTAAFQRLRPDVYAAADLEITHRLRARGVALVAPPPAVFGGQTATLGGDVVSNGILRWIGRTGTALDLARRGAVDDAVVLLGQLVQGGVADVEDVRAAASALPRCRGSRQARTVADLADGLAESPQETRLRLLVLRSGLPCPVAQYRVTTGGRFVARVDLGYPDQRLALEYDGVWHAGTEQFARDRQRLNRLLAAGWRVLFVTARDLHRPEDLVARIAAALTA